MSLQNQQQSKSALDEQRDSVNYDFCDGCGHKILKLNLIEVGDEDRYIPIMHFCKDCIRKIYNNLIEIPEQCRDCEQREGNIHKKDVVK